MHSPFKLKLIRYSEGAEVRILNDEPGNFMQFSYPSFDRACAFVDGFTAAESVFKQLLQSVPITSIDATTHCTNCGQLKHSNPCLSI